MNVCFTPARTERSECRTRLRAGALIPLFAILLPVLFVLIALIINVAYVQLAETQLQVATDAAARAAGRMYALSEDEAVALDFANQAGQENLVAGDALVFEASDLEFGNSTRSGLDARYAFTPSPSSRNAVRVNGRRTDGSSSGEVSRFLPSIIGSTDFSLSTFAESTQVEIDIALVIDRSGSMAYSASETAEFPPAPATAPNGWFFDQPVPANARWLDLVAATEVLINELNKSPQDEFVSLTTYGQKATLDVPLTNNYADIMTGLESHSQGLSVGGTNIGGGLNMGANSLLNGSAREFASKVYLVLTDGIKNVGPNPRGVARSLAGDGAMVFTVTFSNEADRNLMEKVADNGNGKHFHANNGADLITVFQELGRQIPTLITK